MTLFLYIFIFLLQYIHSYNHLLITFAEALLHIFMAADSVGGTSLVCRAEIRTRARLTASQRTTNWSALHPWAALHQSYWCFQILLTNEIAGKVCSLSVAPTFLF